jgi:hypothetical protein
VILLLVRIVRFVIVLLVVRFALRFVAAVIQGYREAGEKEAPAPRAIDTVRDDVCDTFLPRARALVERIGGREQYFCSPACRDRALGAARPRALGARP